MPRECDPYSSSNPPLPPSHHSTTTALPRRSSSYRYKEMVRQMRVQSVETCNRDAAASNTHSYLGTAGPEGCTGECIDMTNRGLSGSGMVARPTAMGICYSGRDSGVGEREEDGGVAFKRA